jgi:hypothetical protein
MLVPRRWSMSEQRLLFDVVPPAFATRLWRRMPPETREQVLAILAEMARRGLVGRQEGKGKAVRHEA